MVPVESIPDPVFIQEMVDGGFSIDPFDGAVFAPISGRIAGLRNAHHIPTMCTSEGIEIPIHISLEIVDLEGHGFMPYVTRDNEIIAGDKLIAFDVDQVVHEAESLLIQMVVANMDTIVPTRPETRTIVDERSSAITIELVTPRARTSAGSGGETFVGIVIIPSPTGLHAWPATTLVALVRSFGNDIKLASQRNAANAKSIVAIVGLGFAHG